MIVNCSVICLRKGVCVYEMFGRFLREDEVEDRKKRKKKKGEKDVRGGERSVCGGSGRAVEGSF